MASGSIGPLSKLESGYFPYIISGFLIILTFWSGAIIHALSFIDWPMSMWHSFLYFLASFFEVIAFSQITNPTLYFVFTGIFFAVILLTYIWDFRMIKNHQSVLSKTAAQRNLYTHIIDQQKFEMGYIVPPGMVFCFLAAFFIYYNIVSDQILITVQVIFLGWFLITTIRSFSKRSKLIEDCSV